MVTADSQSAGRGRRGRSWFAEPGSSLLYSLLVRPIAERPLLPLLIPVAICEAAESLVDLSCEIKWPNDVWVEGKKLAGVLIEGRPDLDPDQSWAVVGVGLNLDLSSARLPNELVGEVAWLGAGIGPDLARERLTEAISSWLEAEDHEVLEAFRSRDLLLGRELTWDGGGGRAAGIDERGHLLVETEEEGTISLGAGEVSISAGLKGG